MVGWGLNRKRDGQLGKYLLITILVHQGNINLREFQFKLLQRWTATNDFLYKIEIKQSDFFTFCRETKENLVHLFGAVKYSNTFWKAVLAMHNAPKKKNSTSQELCSVVNCNNSRCKL